MPTTNYSQVKDDDWNDLNRCLRTIWETLDAVTGRRGTLTLESNLNLNQNRAINAADPVDPQDVVNRRFADSHYVSIGSSGAGITFRGSTNRLARWLSTTSLGSSLISDNGTAINIETAAITINAVAYTWPASQGAASTVLTNDGAGVLSWAVAAAASGWQDTGTAVILTTITDDVGIGIATPAVKVHIKDADEVLRLESTTGTVFLDLYNSSGKQGELAATSTAVEMLNGSGFFFQLTSAYNFGFGIASYGGGQKVLSIPNATVPPTTDPVGGGIMYASGGELKWRSSAGVVYSLTPTGITGSGTANFVAKFSATTAIASSTITDDGTDVTFTPAATVQFNPGSAVRVNCAFSAGTPSQPFRISVSGDLTKINAVDYTWPASQGAADTFLKNDGSGNLSWAAGGTGTVTGTGTTNTLPKWTSATAIGDSAVTDDGTTVTITGRALTVTNTSAVEILHANTTAATNIVQGVSPGNIHFSGAGWTGAASANVSMYLGLVVSTSSSYRLRLQNVGPTEIFSIAQGGVITVYGNILPNASASYDLGASGTRFKDLWLSGTLTGVTITITGDCTANQFLGTLVYGALHNNRIGWFSGGNLTSSSNFTVNNGTGTLSAVEFSGGGVGLTGVNASNLGSGTVPDARFPSTLPAVSGANLTTLNASNISSGTLNTARLPTDVVKYGGSAINGNITVNDGFGITNGDEAWAFNSTDGLVGYSNGSTEVVRINTSTTKLYIGGTYYTLSVVAGIVNAA